MALSEELRRDIMERINAIPIVGTLDMQIVELSQGYCQVKVPRRRKYDGVFESFHGGLLMTVADSAACFSIMTVTGPQVPMTTTDMNIRFLAPCLSDLTVKARPVKVGRTLAPCQVDLFDDQGEQVAVAQVTYILLSNGKDS